MLKEPQSSVFFFNNPEAYTETPERFVVQTPGFNKIVPKLISEFGGPQSGKFSRTLGKKKLLCGDRIWHTLDHFSTAIFSLCMNPSFDPHFICLSLNRKIHAKIAKIKIS
jgi:hypothetical protein